MTASEGRSGFSEGAAVAIASVMLMIGLAGLMVWRVTIAPVAAPPVESGADGEAQRRRVEELQGQLQAAETAAADLGSQLSGVKAQLHDAEAQRLDALANADEADQAERSRARALAAENERMKAQIADLVRQNQALETRVAVLSDATAEAAATPPEALPTATVDGHSVSAKVLHNVRVVDANEELDYVVLDAGKQDGVRAGMVFHVMDGDQVVAKLRAADVRDDLTGATVEDVTSDRYPQPSDRVILRQYSD